MPVALDAAVENSAMRKIYLRLLPFAILCYILAYIDRINVSFAALTMRADLNMSAADFGFAVGTFYWAYFLFEVPSNVIMEKVGRADLDRPHHDHLGHLRHGHGVRDRHDQLRHRPLPAGHGEAGFFPGLILYFTYWFPARHHARIVSGFLVGLPIAVAAGAPVSTALMSLDGLFGLRGWQIMYIAEGLPTIVLGVLFYFLMTDRPEQANFLPSTRRTGWRASSPPSARPRRPCASTRCWNGVEPQGAAAGAQLFRHRHGEPRHAVLHPADHQVARHHAAT